MCEMSWRVCGSVLIVFVCGLVYICLVMTVRADVCSVCVLFGCTVCVCVKLRMLVPLRVCKHDEFVECLRARGCVWGIMHIHVRKAMWCV